MNKNAKLMTFATVAMKFNLWEKVPGLFRMIAAVLRRQYKPKTRTILFGVLAIAYALSPIDLIPDFLAPLLGLGILDDIAIIFFGLNKIFEEVERFLNWEINQNTSNVVDSEVQVIK